MNVLIADLECESLKPSIIHMLGILDYTSDKFTPHIGEEEVSDGLIRLVNADLVIFHNGFGYDIPVIEKLTEGLIVLDQSKIIDTLKLSRKFFPELSKERGGSGHSLEVWGEIFDFPKGDWKKFDKFYPEMVPYCERDCRLTRKIFDFTNELAMSQGQPNMLEIAG
jgi:hypothetical protein